jgi:tellurium resistance protein TerD
MNFHAVCRAVFCSSKATHPLSSPPASGGVFPRRIKGYLPLGIGAMDIEKGLSMAVQYKQQGNKSAARNVLRKILSEDNYNEQAWLLFSEVAEKPEHESQCLKNVYKINPHNSQAIQRLNEIYRNENPINRKNHEDSIDASGDIHPETRLSGIKEFNEPSLNSDKENTQITSHHISPEDSKNTGSSDHPAILPKEYKNPLLTTCKVCQKDVAVNAPTCPYCGVSLPGQRVLCPNCGSSNIEIINKGFSSGNAIAGAVLLGPLGLLGGLYGSKNSQYHCLSCQKTW